MRVFKLSMSALSCSVSLLGCGTVASITEIPGDSGSGFKLAAYNVVSAEMSYLSNRIDGLVDKPDCSLRKKIKIYEPDDDGPFPVLLYFTGTWSQFDSNGALDIIEEAARQGFVAGTVDYQNNTLPSYCNGAAGTYKLRCTYSTVYNKESAVAALCSRAKADCENLGIVAVGFSQGGALAAMGRNWDERVRGAWTMGYGDANSPCDKYSVGTELGSSSSRALANERIRIFRGLNESSNAATLNSLSGRNCETGVTSCLTSPNASGWYRPTSNDITVDRNPNKHCFFQANGKNGFGLLKDCETPDVLDPKWTSKPPLPTFTHGVYENIQWLRRAILPMGPQR